MCCCNHGGDDDDDVCDVNHDGGASGAIQNVLRTRDVQRPIQVKMLMHIAAKKF